MNNVLNYFFLIFFGFLPSLIWLIFYLKRDPRPEPKKLIFKIFLLGMVVTLPVFLLEKIIYEKFYFSITFSFLGAAFIEEFFKFLVVKEKVLKDPEFDQPIDAMIYMIVSALGFAAIENILVLFRFTREGFMIFKILILRFFGATFLHTLCSGIIGFFLGLSFFKEKERGKLVLLGFLLAVPLHGFYNFSILKEKGEFLIPLILMGSTIFIFFAFKKLKEIEKNL